MALAMIPELGSALKRGNGWPVEWGTRSWIEAKSIEPTGDPEVFRCPVSGLEPLEAPGVGFLSFCQGTLFGAWFKGTYYFLGGFP